MNSTLMYMQQSIKANAEDMKALAEQVKELQKQVQELRDTHKKRGPKGAQRQRDIEYS